MYPFDSGDNRNESLSVICQLVIERLLIKSRTVNDLAQQT